MGREATATRGKDMADKMKTAFRIGTGALGLIGIISGGKAVWQGASGFLGEALAGVTDPGALMVLDNEFRFFAGIWFLVGLSMLLGAIFIHKRPRHLQIGLEAILVGGLARAFAFAEYGFQAQFMPAILIEIIVPAVLLVLMVRWQKAESAT